MKKLGILLCFLFIGVFTSVFAQNNCFRIQKNDYESIQINFHFDVQNLKVLNVKTDSGLFTRVSYEDLCLTREVGKPELPEFSKLVEIPLCENVKIKVNNANYTIIDAEELGIQHPIFPAQPSYSKSDEGPIALVKDVACYQEDQFYGPDLAGCDKVGISRNINLGNLTLCPISYNPVSKQIKFYTDVEVEISFDGANIPATLEMKNLHSNGFFSKNPDFVINPITEEARSDQENAPVKYLIVAHSMFRNNEQLASFINWKKRLGYIVEIGYTDDSAVGTTTTSIANFIKSHYTQATADNPAPTFLLLIGDVAQIPVFDSRISSYSYNDHITDLYYACWTQGDNIPDCYYGRFSAQNVSQLNPQIEKTLIYEQYTMPDPNYLAKAVAVAGTDSYWGPLNANWQIQYLTNNYLNTAQGYSTVYAHYYNSSSQAATIRAEIGDGVGYANYTAHCSSSGWADPSFTSNHVSSMSNTGRYGLIIGNCCLSGKFDDNACFGETLLRADKKGAMAYIGASNSTIWDEDYYWSVGYRSTVGSTSYQANNLGAYDRLWHTHNENHSDWFVTNGGIVRAGNLSVESSTSDLKLYYWEIYHLFGDPSVKPYLGIPTEIIADVPSNIPAGLTNMTIQTEPYAYVALTHNTELVAAIFADASGNATITLPSNLELGQYEVAITAQNRIPFFQNVEIISAEGSFIVATIQSNDENNLTNNSTANWNLTLNNLGLQASQNTSVKISSSSNNISFSPDTFFVGTIQAGQSITLSNAFQSQINPGVEDRELANITITPTFDGNTSNRSYNFPVNAPKLQLDEFIINAGTTSAGCINPGETGTITFVISNAGHNGISNLITKLTSMHDIITVNTGSINIASLNNGQSTTINFEISVDSLAEMAALYPMAFSIFNNEYQLGENFRIPIGKAMEDFESNNFTTFDWNQGSYPWEITSSNVYAGSYSARSKSGLPNGSYSNRKESILEISLNVTQDSPISYFRKVSSEESYDLFRFYIDGTIKEELSGEEAWGESSFDVPAGNHTFKFVYSKDQSASSGSDCAWIDNITFPITGALIEPTSIKNNDIDQQLSVFPNPTNGQLTIQCDKMMQTIEIINIMGQSVQHIGNIANQHYTLNVSNWANAIYFVKVTDTDNQVYIQKIIKK